MVLHFFLSYKDQVHRLCMFTESVKLRSFRGSFFFSSEMEMLILLEAFRKQTVQFESSLAQPSKPSCRINTKSR